MALTLITEWRHCVALLELISLFIMVAINPIEASYLERKSLFNSKGIFTNSFLVRFHQPVEKDFAKQLANKYGFESLGAVS